VSGRTALVTGGGRGIGFAIASGLAEQGANVALVARTKEQLTKACEEIRAATDREAWSFAYDLADIGGIEGLFADVLEKAGGVDILVNCAGTTVRGPSEDIDLEDWERVQNVNLKSVLVLSQMFCRHRKDKGGRGSIINIGSLMCDGARPTTAAGCFRRPLPGDGAILRTLWVRRSCLPRRRGSSSRGRSSTSTAGGLRCCRQVAAAAETCVLQQRRF